MNMNVKILLTGLLLLAGVFVFPAAADLGLNQILADQGVEAVGAAVKVGADAVYAGTDDPAEIKSQLIAILNEAAATGDEGAMRYAIVAVMMAGGADNLDLSKDAINNSDVATDYPQITEFTVSAAEGLILTAGGGEEGDGDDEDKKGGGADDEGEQGGGGAEEDDTLGGGSPELFDPDTDGIIDEQGSSIEPFGTIDDRDSAATPV